MLPAGNELLIFLERKRIVIDASGITHQPLYNNPAERDLVKLSLTTRM
ncbi:hypothetical protein HZB97_01210 [Candidatus Gottesmanbacteria bacterium]|nr:hypothetical protein [Candidatus Gottesmanbacteria bacterium]